MLAVLCIYHIIATNLLSIAIIDIVKEEPMRQLIITTVGVHIVISL